MTYTDYLKTDHWKKMVRLYRKDRCEICSRKDVQLHHLTYKNIGKEKAADFATLCSLCHRACHVGLLGNGKLRKPSSAGYKVLNRIRLGVSLKNNQTALFYRRRLKAEQPEIELPSFKQVKKMSRLFFNELGYNFKN